MSQLATLSATGQPTPRQANLKSLFRVLAVIIGPVACTVPTVTTAITIVSLTFTQAMSSYWAVSSLFAVSQNLSLRFPIVRRSLGIPKTPSEPEKPMRHLFESAKTNFAEFKADVREKNFKG